MGEVYRARALRLGRSVAINPRRTPSRYLRTKIEQEKGSMGADLFSG
jgi:hypothetical protein